MSAVRAATTEDAPLLARLHAESFDTAWDARALKDLLKTPGSIALMTGEGFVLIRAAADEAEILTICVAPAARGRGIGSALLQAAGNAAAKQGATTMFLEVVSDNAPARALYAAHGFQPVGRRKAYFEGKDALVMRAALPLAFRMGNPEKTL